MNTRTVLAWGALLSVLGLATFLGIREGTHRAAKKADAAKLKIAEAQLGALRTLLTVATGKVDTVIVVVDSTRAKVDTLVQRLDDVALRRLREAQQAGRLRERADSLLLAVDPRVILDNGPAVRAAYAYRLEADTLRSQLARSDADLLQTRITVGEVNADLTRVQGQLEDVYGMLSNKDRDISALTDTLRTLRAAREDRCIWGLITCPSRTTTALAAAGVGLVGGFVVGRTGQ